MLLSEGLFYHLSDFSLRSPLVAKAVEPEDVRLAAEPCQLALSVVAMALLGQGNGVSFTNFSAQKRFGLFVSQRIEWPCIAVFFQQHSGLFDQAVPEHRRGAFIDAVVQAFAVRLQTDAQDTEASQWVAAFFPCFRHGLSRGNADLNGANQLWRVVGMDTFSGPGVEPHEDFVEPSAPVLFTAQLEPLAQRLGALRAGKEAVQQSAKVEAGPSGNDGNMAARGNFFQRASRIAAVVARGVVFSGGNNVNQVVRKALAVGLAGLGCADLHVAVDGDGIAAHDFSVIPFGEMK